MASPNATPFLITVQDAIMLEHSEGFNILRYHLSRECQNDFCSVHKEFCTFENKQSWIVMRDLLHALLAPIVALFDNAARIAKKVTHAITPEDLEFAFRGRARGAFVWLQSFLASDEDFCLSRGCPACIVERAIDAEFPIRLIVAACMLSKMQGRGDHGRPTLPSFDFFLYSLREALDEDDLWGPDYFDYIEPKALGLKLGMQDLIKQSSHLESTMTPPATPEEDPLPTFSYFSGRNGKSSGAALRTFIKEGMPVKLSKLAKQQSKMKVEEEELMALAVQNCWQSLNPHELPLPTEVAPIRRVSVGGP